MDFFPLKMFLSPSFEIECQMPLRTVIIRVISFRKFGNLNVFKYFYSFLRVKEIHRWKHDVRKHLNTLVSRSSADCHL